MSKLMILQTITIMPLISALNSLIEPSWYQVIIHLFILYLASPVHGLAPRYSKQFLKEDEEENNDDDDDAHNK